MSIKYDDDYENSSKSKSIPSSVDVGKNKKEDTIKCNQTLSTAFSSITAVKPVPKVCMDWVCRQASQRLSNTIEEWLEGRGLGQDKGGNKIKLSLHCQIVSIPYKIF